MTAVPSYENDGSGRDTYINHAGAFWLNPLPGGTYHKSLRADRPPAGSLSGGAVSTRDVILAESIDPFASVRPPGRELFGQSRYGTTVLQGGTGNSGESRDGNGRTAADSVPAAAQDSEAAPFDPEATALATIPDDVANPERRLMTPGHSTTGLEGTGGASTFTGTKDPWAAPNQVDNTLLRIRPTYESTCHFGLRTGRFYVPDEAPAPEATILDKSKTRYY